MAGYIMVSLYPNRETLEQRNKALINIENILMSQKSDIEDKLRDINLEKEAIINLLSIRS